MENNKKIQLGLLGLVAVLLVGFMISGSFSKFFGKSESDKIREAALTSNATSQNATTAVSEGNIPGTNTTTTQAPTGPVTTIKNENEKFEFGVVDEGEVVKHLFKFTNTGNEPLLISNCKGSCGCTVPTWPKQPIPPGGTGEIKVEFNTKGKPSKQSKRVTVTANTNPSETFLEVTGDVRGKEQPAAKTAPAATGGH